MTLTVDNLEVVAGQPLTGLVRINMRTSGPVSKLTLEIEGKEYGVYKEQKKPDQSSYLGPERKFTERIIGQTYTLKQFEREILPGIYDFRFSIDLPTWLPPSMKFSPLQKCEFTVEYNLKAEFTPWA